MRTLIIQELQHVSGGSYTEDISAASATLVVGGIIGAAASTITHVFLTTGAGMSGFTSLSYLATIISPAMAIVVPLAIAGVILYINPEMQDTLAMKYHSYFG